MTTLAGNPNSPSVTAPSLYKLDVPGVCYHKKTQKWRGHVQDKLDKTAAGKRKYVYTAYFVDKADAEAATIALRANVDATFEAVTAAWAEENAITRGLPRGATPGVVEDSSTVTTDMVLLPSMAFATSFSLQRDGKQVFITTGGKLVCPHGELTATETEGERSKDEKAEPLPLAPTGSAGAKRRADSAPSEDLDGSCSSSSNDEDGSAPSGRSSKRSRGPSEVPALEHVLDAILRPECFKCGQTGHWARDCPECFKCGQTGHWPRYCPNSD